MAGSSSACVAGLMAAAVAAVGFLTHQASATAPGGLGVQRTANPGTAKEAPRERGHPSTLPVHSGNGRRVVYSLGTDRVWLVGADTRVERTFRVTPGSVDPSPGTYAVTSRSGTATGTDGTPVEHVVRFATVQGVTVGFSAAVGKARRAASATPPRTGGIRESRMDGKAMWTFATIGQRVTVIR